ncbi:MAG: glutamine amidotransferase [Verrucomicrobiales bacterium]
MKNFAAEQIGWVSDLVTERGGGLLMAGGISSFDSGQYDRTPWEKLIPVDMLGFGAGFYDRLLTLDIPDTVKDHPLWKLDSDPEKNAEILAAHPPFFGMNRVRRAKPGAVVLALRAGTDEPVIAAQTYGRGRSVAYLPDPNGGWGDRYATWGPSGVVTGERIEIGQGAEFIFSSDAARVPATPVPPHPSPWYGR